MLWWRVVKAPSPGLAIANEQASHVDGLAAIAPTKCDVSEQQQQKKCINLKQKVADPPSRVARFYRANKQITATK